MGGWHWEGQLVGEFEQENCTQLRIFLTLVPSGADPKFDLEQSEN